MRFQVLSHAGLLVESKKGKSLICDPWLLGSCYWRSWWNYPPVSTQLIKNLKPDYIYLTHIHWDHFHGPSLAKFAKETPIIVPKGNYSRIKDDLNFLGYNNVRELKHGESFSIDNDFKITSYQFWMFLDSALVVECEDIKLLNLNDTKLMGAPLQHIIRKHRPIDFVFRSHSSANERLSYEITDDENAIVDDLDHYIEEFALSVSATGAKYAIPFASNHCHLHKDSFHFNKYIQHPQLVKNYFKAHNITSPELRTMVSGDSWSSDDGFNISNVDWFTNREFHLKQYQEQNAVSLNKFYEEEDKTIISKEIVEEYFSKLSRYLPLPLKIYFRHVEFHYVLHTEGRPRYIYKINVSSGRVTDISHIDADELKNCKIQIHTTAFIFLRAIEYKIFSHMCIGKRVFYKVDKQNKKFVEMLNQVFNCYEYDIIPLRKLFTGRAIQSWAMRWREIGLYLNLAKDKFISGKINISKYLKPHK